MSRIAIVHERWTEQGGSENVVRALAAQWPEAAIHVAFADPASVPDALRSRMVVTGLDRVHRVIGRRAHGPLIALAPSAWRRHRVDATVDAVVISHHAAAISAAKRWAQAGVPVVAYIHSPARWGWDARLRAEESLSRMGHVALGALAHRIRSAELAGVPHLSAVVANSAAVAERIEQWWGIEARVVAPPVDVERFTPGPTDASRNYFLAAGRLVPNRRIDLAIRAAQRAGVRLIVAGEGRHEAHLREIAGTETEFLGRVSDARMVELQRGARASLMPGHEDFGIVPVEAMAAGTPVIARRAAGALDTVIPDVSGVFVEDVDDRTFVDLLAAAMVNLGPHDFEVPVLRAHAEQFSAPVFRARMNAVVDSVLAR